jgi:hypothetical protein
MVRSTNQQIQALRKLEEYNAEYMRREIARVVENAITAAANGDRYPLEQLHKIAAMEVSSSITNFLPELRAALERVNDGEV